MKMKNREGEGGTEGEMKRRMSTCELFPNNYLLLKHAFAQLTAFSTAHIQNYTVYPLQQSKSSTCACE